MTDTDTLARARTLLGGVAETWATFGFAEQLTCAEADDLTHALILLGADDQAVALLAAHSTVDQPGDPHHWPSGDREDQAALRAVALLTDTLPDDPTPAEREDPMPTTMVNDADHAALDTAWNEAFTALRAAGLEADADDPIAAHYRAVSDTINHANRKREARLLTLADASRPEPVALAETQRRTRGHRFYPPKAVLKKIPALYGTESTPAAEKRLHVKFFTGPFTWYVAELDPATGDAYGLTVDEATRDESWGYFNLPELEAVRPSGTFRRVAPEPAAGESGFTHTGTLRWVAERDLYWSPVTAADL